MWDEGGRTGGGGPGLEEEGWPRGTCAALPRASRALASLSGFYVLL